MILESKQVQIEVDALKFEKEQLEEKLKQIKLQTKLKNGAALKSEEVDLINQQLRDIKS